MLSSSDGEKIQRLLAENEAMRNQIVQLQEALNEKDTLIKAYQNDGIKQTLRLEKSNEKISAIEKQGFRYKFVKKDNKKFYYYTGITRQKFKWIMEGLNNAKQMTKKLSRNDHLFLVLVKLRLGLSNSDLAYRFVVPFSVVSKVYRNWLIDLAGEMKKRIYWPEKSAIRRNLPRCFKPKYTKCVCIIDCTEIFIDRPLSLTTRAQTWSNYKNNNTIKYLIACSPSGGVSFISNGWGGRVSDKEITLKSGFLNLIENGDQVLADRGFTIEEDLAAHGGVLVIPAFTKGKTQLSAAEVDTSRQVANVRIHRTSYWKVAKLQNTEYFNTNQTS